MVGNRYGYRGSPIQLKGLDLAGVRGYDRDAYSQVASLSLLVASLFFGRKEIAEGEESTD